MKIKRLCCCTLAFFFFYFLCHPSAGAAIDQNSPWTKLGRGMGNLTFGWVEIFNQPNQMTKTERWPIAIYGGVPKGILYALGRTLIGAYEVVTFPVPIPSRYQPLILPEFVLAKEI